jgi:hypothetical protein
VLLLTFHHAMCPYCVTVESSTGRSLLALVVLLVVLPFFLGIAIGRTRLPDRLFQASLLLQGGVFKNFSGSLFRLACQLLHLHPSHYLILIHNLQSSRWV